ncbi:MAG TPA: GIY-YIG nuclease family protein [Chloroflexi bacterium]|nr:GIY-YIG nuclease family protein [Chloroflexota bacterium]
MGTPGTYVLVLNVQDITTVGVGRLGTFVFGAGHYCYVGSARGPGGLTARLARHLTHAKRPHWHIDYLLQRAVVVEIWSRCSAERLECSWTEALLRLRGAQPAVAGFGSSDCRCPTHLVYLNETSSLTSLRRHLRHLGAAPWRSIQPPCPPKTGQSQ